MGAYARVFTVRCLLSGGTLTWAPLADVALIVATGVVIAGYQAASEEIVFRGAV